MHRAAEYLRRAEEADLEALSAPDEKSRRQCLDRAANLRELALQTGGLWWPVRPSDPD